MATRISRSDTGSSLGDGVDENCEGEDPQTQQDYDDFKKWLESLDAEQPHPSKVNPKPRPSQKPTGSQAEALPGPPSQGERASSSSLGPRGHDSTMFPSGDMPLPCSTYGKPDSCNTS